MFSSAFKRIPALLLIAIVAFPQSAGAALFADASGTPYAVAIETLGQEGVIHGYDDGLSHPGWAINRAEALKVLIGADPVLMAQAQRLKLKMPSIPLFDDITQKEWYAPYVEVAFRQGIVTGYPDGTFRPSRRVSTEEAVALVLRAFNITSVGALYQSPDSAPNSPGQWFTDGWSTAANRNLFLQEVSIAPGQAMTRGYFFHLVVKARALKQQPVVQGPAVVPPVVPPTPIPTPQTDPTLSAYLSQKSFAISIPSLGISDVTVGHPDDLSSKGLLTVLQDGLGHLFSYPGDGGKVLIYGHSSGYPWDISQYTKVFRTINKLKPGERIYLTYNGKLYVYQVSSKEVIPAKDTSAFEPDDSGEDLILYTCWPPDSISNRYLVHASPVGDLAIK